LLPFIDKGSNSVENENKGLEEELRCMDNEIRE
jgi:hypothetical protein